MAPSTYSQTAKTPTPTRKSADIVASVLRIGYRHIDTAQHYGTERGVGEAIAESGLPRDQVFVTTKLANAKHRPDDVRRSFDDSLQKLGLAHIDVATWRAMTELVVDGRLRSAGVSNFEPDHLDRIIGETGIVPVVNQIEVHAEFANTAAVEATRRHGIAVEAWSPLGQGKVLENPVIERTAAASGKTAAQIILRWHMQHDHIIFPKSTRPERMEENFRLFDFELLDEEVASIDALDKGEAGRIGPHPNTFAWIPEA